MQEKERVLGKEEGETKLRIRGIVETRIVSLRIDLICLYLKLGYSYPFIYSIFLYFYYFINMNSILFPIK